jgi:hypothetical protein
MTLRTQLTVAAILGLSVGILAVAHAGAGKAAIAAAKPSATHQTVIHKNSVLPLPGRIALDACSIAKCRDA